MSEPNIAVHCGGLFQTNGYLVAAGDHRYLFDAPGDVLPWLKSHGIKLDGLILTHQHHDHVVDAAAVQEAFGCETWAFSKPDPDLTLARNLEQMTGLPCDLGDYRVDHIVTEDGGLSLPGLELSVMHVPGHSPDSLCFKLGDSSVVIAGDVLFRGSIGRTDFPHSDHDALINGIREKLWPLDDKTRILPGHGPETTVGLEKRTNPFVGGVAG
ncbi:MAG: MBL fold metallo-hydrolase [Verrucomicrobiota bacterium]